MKLSLIMPVYNTSKYLNRCLDSILKQTYKNIEIICINDGSTDNSLEILERYASDDKRIKVIDQKNKGVSVSRNVGLDVATGDLVAFVDSDDAVIPDMYEVMIDNMISNDASISACDVYRIKDGEIYDYGKNDSKIVLVENPILDFLLNQNLQYVIANKVFKRDLIGNIRFDSTLTNSEDRLFLYEVYKNKPKAVKYNCPKYIYYTNSESASNSVFSLKLESVIKSATIICDDILKNYQEFSHEADEYMFENLIIFERKLALSANKKDYLDYYNNVRQRIIELSTKITLNKKRKLEVLILKYFNFLYPLFLKVLYKHKSKIDYSKVADDVNLH